MHTKRLVRNGFLVLAISVLLACGATAAQAAKQVSVTKDGVNIRSSPSTNADILWEVFEGYPLLVLDDKNDWLQVQDFEGDKGWVYKSLVSDKKTLIVTVDNANMRAEPNTKSKVVATVKRGVVFAVEKTDGAWSKVNYKNDVIGWMHNSLIWPTK